jgi:hypothetical protein|tara:strand:+ start:220 stop:456 length:237 start_codon:yes stop_codon:yes gene_type:complete
MRSKPQLNIYTFTLTMSVESSSVDDAFAAVLDELIESPENVIDDVSYEVRPSLVVVNVDKLGLNQDTEVVWTSDNAES